MCDEVCDVEKVILVYVCSKKKQVYIYIYAQKVYV